MLCAACKQKEATVHLTEITEDKISKLHLCRDCAREKGVDEHAPVEVNNLLASMAEVKPLPEQEDVKCPECGISFSEFRKEGRLGCGRCYQAFSAGLLSLIGNIQHGEMHEGKVPASARSHSPSAALKRLKADLARAVSEERFEEAARLRDRIRQLEEKGSGSSGNAPPASSRGGPDGD